MDQIKQLTNKFSIARYDLIRACEESELRLYLYLKLYAINKHEAFPSYKTIKGDLGWSEGKISKVIKKMIKAGHLKVGKKLTKTKGGKQQVNIYDITWYDKVNEKGIPKSKVFPFGNPLFEKGVSKSDVEPSYILTNNIKRLNEMKASLLNKMTMRTHQQRTED